MLFITLDLVKAYREEMMRTILPSRWVITMSEKVHTLRDNLLLIASKFLISSGERLRKSVRANTSISMKIALLDNEVEYKLQCKS